MIITPNEIIYKLAISKTFDVSKFGEAIDMVVREYLRPRLGLEFYTALNTDRINLGLGTPYDVYSPATAYSSGDEVVYNNVPYICIATPPAAGYNPQQVLYWAYTAPFTTAKYSALWDYSLFAFTSYAVLLEALPFVYNSVQASGVLRNTDEFGSSVSGSEFAEVKKKTAENVEKTWRQTDDFLRLVNDGLSIDNPALYPLYSGNCTEEKKGNPKFGIIF